MKYDLKGIYEEVDGLENPLQLLCEDMRGYKLPWPVISRLEYQPGDGKEYRRVSPGVDGSHSYEIELHLYQGEMTKIFAELSKIRGKALRVLDSGCGRGLALSSLVKLDSVSRETSYGLTLPGTAEIDTAIKNRVIQAPVQRLRPRKFRRFDVVLSIFGTNYYHPFDQGVDHLFALLQSIAQLQEGGVLIDNTSISYSYTLKTPSFALLQRAGILGELSLESTQGRNHAQGSMAQVLRHPEAEEIVEILSPFSPTKIPSVCRTSTA